MQYMKSAKKDEDCTVFQRPLYFRGQKHSLNMQEQWDCWEPFWVFLAAVSVDTRSTTWSRTMVWFRLHVSLLRSSQCLEARQEKLQEDSRSQNVSTPNYLIRFEADKMLKIL